MILPSLSVASARWILRGSGCCGLISRSTGSEHTRSIARRKHGENDRLRLDFSLKFPIVSPYRIAIVCSHPIQYLAPWFADLAQHPRLDLTVYYGHDHGLA